MMPGNGIWKVLTLLQLVPFQLMTNLWPSTSVVVVIEHQFFIGSLASHIPLDFC